MKTKNNASKVTMPKIKVSKHVGGRPNDRGGKKKK